MSLKGHLIREKDFRAGSTGGYGHVSEGNVCRAAQAW